MGSNIFKTLRVIKTPIKSFVGFIESSVSLLKFCTNQRLITEGQVLHSHFFKLGIASNRHLSIKLLIMYLDFKKSNEVDQLLKDHDEFDIIVQNCLISANVNWGNLDKARKVFDEMPERNEVSWTALISGYLKYGKIDESVSLFRRNPFQNVISWTAAISGLSSNGLHSKSMEFFVEMLRSGVTPNVVTFVSIVKACGEMGGFQSGIAVFGLAVKIGIGDDVSVCNSMITFSLKLRKPEMAVKIFEKMAEKDVISWTAILGIYVEIGDLEKARKVFDEMPERNEVSWSAMISSYSQQGQTESAFELFCQMVENGINPNSSCLSSVINGLANVKALPRGKTVHAHVVKIGMAENVFVSSSLIDLYGSCGETNEARLVFDSVFEKNAVIWNSMISAYSFGGKLEEAEKLFYRIPVKTIGSWNSMVSGYLRNEQHGKVFEVFNEMILSGQNPDISTLSTVLTSCANLASLSKGKNVHGKTIKLGFQHDVFVNTALIDMYSKSGDIETAKKVFSKTPEKNEVSWTVMIQGLAENGFAKETLELFESMETTTFIEPNELILLAILFACSHCGLVEKGLDYFKKMAGFYGLKPNERHYTCLVDLLSRSGRIREAEAVIISMPMEAEVNSWAALLGGCKIYGEEEVAERAAVKLRQVAERKSGGFVMLSNVYAAAGKWPEVVGMRKLMKEKGVKKNGGCSWIEVKNELNLFYSQDGSHVDSNEIYGVLELLNSNMVVEI